MSVKPIEEMNEKYAQIYLGACALLAPEIKECGFIEAENRIDKDVHLATKVWDGPQRAFAVADLREHGIGL